MSYALHMRVTQKDKLLFIVVAAERVKFGNRLSIKPCLHSYSLIMNNCGRPLLHSLFVNPLERARSDISRRRERDSFISVRR